MVSKQMNKTKLKKQKGTSLIVVFIICTCIAILLFATFLVTKNYYTSVLSRKKDLYRNVQTNENTTRDASESILPESGE